MLFDFFRGNFMADTTNPTHANQLLSPVEAAEFLGVSPQTLASWRCLRRYSLPYTRVGRLIRYYRTDLEAFLRDRTVTMPTGVDAATEEDQGEESSQQPATPATSPKPRRRGRPVRSGAV